MLPDKMSSIIHIKAFGMVAEKIGNTELSMIYIDDSEELLEVLRKKFPQLESVNFSLAVNKKMITGRQAIPVGAEIALLPPFSGG
jgi:molybdopterin synthase sulfur carrier subunit